MIFVTYCYYFPYVLLIYVAPIFSYSIFERDVSDHMLRDHARPYSTNRDTGIVVSWKTVLYWTCLSFYHTFVVIWLMFYFYSSAEVNPSGYPHDLWAMGIFGSTLCILIVTISVALETRYWIWITHLSIWGSLVLYILGIWVLCSTTAFNPELVGVLEHLLNNGYTFVALVCGVVVAMVPDFAYRGWTRMFKPTDAQILQEADIKNQASSTKH